MELLKHASEALQRHLSAVLMYLGFAVLWSLANSGTAVYLLARYPDTVPTLPEHIVRIVSFTVLSGVCAFAQAVVFSRIGREMDRPLWKVRDDREALQRFFFMWFEFNLLINTLSWIAGTPLFGDEPNALNALAVFAVLVGVVLVIPVGAASMFHGHFSWSKLGECLAPLGRRPMEALPVFLVTFGQFLLPILALQAPDRDVSNVRHVAFSIAVQLALDLVIAYLDCLAFAAIWLVCKDDRDSPDEVDLDF